MCLVLSADLAKSTIALVDEGYPAECINWRTVLETTRSRFRVKGMPIAPVAKESAPAEEASNQSLSLKPSGKHKHAPTPSQNSDQVHVGLEQAEKPTEAKLEEKILENRSPRERDALDDMIDETKAVKDLVGDMNSLMQRELTMVAPRASG